MALAKSGTTHLSFADISWVPMNFYCVRTLGEPTLASGLVSRAPARAREE